MVVKAPDDGSYHIINLFYGVFAGVFKGVLHSEPETSRESLMSFRRAQCETRMEMGQGCPDFCGRIGSEIGFGT
jgi:hypothetical protein